MRKGMVFLLVTVTMMTISACGNGNKGNTLSEDVTSVETEETYAEFTWPTSDIAKLLPVPESSIGKIGWEASYGFVIDVAETSVDDFKEYVNACKEAGFTVDYQAGDDYYYGDNEEGYHISLHYEHGDVMFIRIDEPKEEETSENTEATEKAESDTVETELSEVKESGIRSEFKEAMDSYEVFFDEYCAFMKKYSETDNPVSMLGDYADYMTKYTDAITKMSEIESEELSTEELVYYTEVNARITKKLSEVAQ